jgi:hypothetical protein
MVMPGAAGKSEVLKVSKIETPLAFMVARR